LQRVWQIGASTLEEPMSTAPLGTIADLPKDYVSAL